MENLNFTGLKVDDDAEVDQKDHIDIIIMKFEKVKVAVNMTSKYINPLKRIKEFAHDQRKVKLSNKLHCIEVMETQSRKNCCTQCEKSFGRTKYLKRHMLIHSGVKAFSCSECEKSFGRAGGLQRHMVTHTGEKIHKCAECGNTFGQGGDLKKHMLIHSGVRAHTCSECEKSFVEAGNLRKHMTTHTGERVHKY